MIDFQFQEDLQNVFHYESFRNISVYTDPFTNNKTEEISQLNILNLISEQINKAVNGKRYKDIFFTASTGSGKSLLFQLPAVELHRNNFLTIVITPLKALMKDQVYSLKRIGIHFAAYINSDNTFIEREETLMGIKEGRYSLIYLSPEFIVKYRNLDSLFGLNNGRRIGFFVIDEAHCVSTWGKSFRPDYWFIGKRFRVWRDNVHSNAPILALTATAVNGGDYDSVGEIIDQLNLKNPKVILSQIRRSNITIKIEKYIPRNGSYNRNKKDNFVADKIKELSSKYKKILIYHPFKSAAYNLDAKLKESGVSSSIFVGGMDKEQRNKVYKDFRTGQINCVVATKAFGMGVDIDDIDCVYHYAINKSLTDYVQEIGRAGRKKNLKSLAITDFHSKDLNFTRILNTISGLSQWQLRSILKKIMYIYNSTNHKSKKNAWIMVYPETFVTIFRKSDDIEKKMEASLLLIEKDLESVFGYPLLNFGIPRYSTVYCAIDKDNLGKLKKTPYISCFKKVFSVDDNIRREYGNSSGDETKVYDIGDIWEINLEQLWENFFKDDNLYTLRHRFYSPYESLIGGVKLYPRIEIKARIKENYKKTKSALNYILESLEDIFDSFNGKFFTRNELQKKLYSYGLKKDYFVDLILRFFKIEGYPNDYPQDYQFIFEKQNKFVLC